MRRVSDAPHTHGITMGWAAPFYDFYCPLLGLGEEFRHATLDLAGVHHGDHVLDVGCGTGVLTRLAAAAAGSTGVTIGIDAAPAMIAKARSEATRRNSTAQFRVAVIEDLPFETGRFDVVFSSLMLHHLPPDTKLQGLREVRRVLKPDGRLVVVDIDRPALPWWLLAWPLLFMPSVLPNLRGEIPDYLRRAGFRRIEEHGRRYGLLCFRVACKEDGRPP